MAMSQREIDVLNNVTLSRKQRERNEWRANMAEWKAKQSGSFVFLTHDNWPPDEPSPWHFDQDGDAHYIDYRYWIERPKSVARAIGWLKHLAGKNWFNHYELNALLRGWIDLRVLPVSYDDRQSTPQRSRHVKTPRTPINYRRAMTDLLLERQQGKCSICDKHINPLDVVHIDHYIPLAKGGTNAVANLRATHSVCNIAKGAS